MRLLAVIAAALLGLSLPAVTKVWAQMPLPAPEPQYDLGKLIVIVILGFAAAATVILVQWLRGRATRRVRLAMDGRTLEITGKHDVAEALRAFERLSALPAVTKALPPDSSLD